jgi:hypothetical protein
MSGAERRFAEDETGRKQAPGGREMAGGKRPAPAREGGGRDTSSVCDGNCVAASMCSIYFIMTIFFDDANPGASMR